MITVVNKRTDDGTAPGARVYIGRPSPLGNPWSHKPGTLAAFRAASREDAITAYDGWIRGALKPRFANAQTPIAIEFDRLCDLARRGDIVLVCWCAPLACHGDVLKKLIEARLEREAATDFDHHEGG